MKISSKGRYSLRMLADLAEHYDEGYVALRDVAERQEISKKYLEQLAALLSRFDILRASRGSQGGYMLAKPPEQYKLSQILQITEGGICPVACLEDEPNRCARSKRCKTLPLWKGLNAMIGTFLENTTLKDMVDGTMGEIRLKLIKPFEGPPEPAASAED
ncbi:MAG: Rrf2 family transcriptional regulator [Clostridiales bacterium]|nr:Rrf2 family transcriptional regulator [Clostridiales bacterium]